MKQFWLWQLLLEKKNCWRDKRIQRQKRKCKKVKKKTHNEHTTKERKDKEVELWTLRRGLTVQEPMRESHCDTKSFDSALLSVMPCTCKWCHVRWWWRNKTKRPKNKTWGEIGRVSATLAWKGFKLNIWSNQRSTWNSRREKRVEKWAKPFEFRQTLVPRWIQVWSLLGLWSRVIRLTKHKRGKKAVEQCSVSRFSDFPLTVFNCAASVLCNLRCHELKALARFSNISFNRVLLCYFYFI